MMKKILFTFLIMFCWVGNALCFPALTGWVVDDAHILSQQTKHELTTLLQSEKKHQVVVVTLPSLDGENIEDYGYKLGRHWGIGEKENNNGVLLIIAPNEKQVRIEVGYGLEGILTDVTSSTILTNMTEALKENNYNQATLIGVQQILDTIQGENFSQTTINKITQFEICLICLVLILFIYVAMAPRNERAKRLKFVLTIFSFFPGKRGGFRRKGGSFGGGGASKRF